MWKEVIKIMTHAYTFKPTDMLVKSQVTMFLLGLYTTIEDVPPLYNLRDAVLEAMGMTYEDFETEEEVEEEELEQ